MQESVAVNREADLEQKLQQAILQLSALRSGLRGIEDNTGVGDLTGAIRNSGTPYAIDPSRAVYAAAQANCRANEIISQFDRWGRQNPWYEETLNALINQDRHLC